MNRRKNTKGKYCGVRCFAVLLAGIMAVGNVIPVCAAGSDEGASISPEQPAGSSQVLNLTAVDCSSENEGYKKEYAVDGVQSTFWHNQWEPQAEFPHWIELDLGQIYALNGLDVMPRQDMIQNSNPMAITEFNLYAKNEENEDYTLVADHWIMEIPEPGEYAQIRLPENVSARYIKLESLTDNSGENTAIAELTAWFDKESKSTAWMELYDGIVAARKAAGSVRTGTEPDQFPAEAVDAFLTAIDEAETYLDSTDTDEELAKAAETLTDAQNELESNRILYTLEQFEELVKKAKEMQEKAEGPNAELRKELGNAIKDAELLLGADQDAQEIHKAYMQLSIAYGKFEAKCNCSEISLAGVWDFETGAFESDNTLGDEVTLPGTMDENKKGIINNDHTDKTRLSPRYTYVGKASYQKEIIVPDNWAGKKITLTLERTRKTKVWLNDTLIGESDALGVEQTFDLTGLDPTKENILTIEVDNSCYETNTWYSHMAVKETQGNWNGIVGEISLKMQEPVYIDDVRIYSDKHSPEDETVNVARIQLDAGNLTKKDTKVTVTVNAKSRNTEKPEQVVASQEFSATLSAGKTTSLEFCYDMGDNVYLWDEFDPALYDFTVTLSSEDISETCTVSSGMREFTADEDHFIINGKKIFLRGEANCAVFPLTAYPPMDKEYWMELLGTAQEYGLNHYRFHSWSPPKAAYEAADELGMYLQPELYAFNGDPFATGSTELDFYERESKRILKDFANHPSFTTFAYGNEMNPTESNSVRLLDKLKELDSTRLYTTGSNNWKTENGHNWGDQFWTSLSTHKGDGQVRGSNGEKGFINMESPNTARTYFNALDGVDLPFISHEIGQFQQYPDFNQIEKYTGVFEARNLKIAKASLESKGMGDQNQEFAEASGALASICYRAEVEAALRTGNQGGYQLLGLQDFPGQGSALVGILDSFMDLKPGMPAGGEFKRYNSDVTALALMPQYVWTNDETFTARIQIANYGEGDLNGVRARWVFKHQDGAVIAQGEGEAMDLPQGELTTVDEISASLASLKKAEQIKLEVGLVGDPILSNEYDVWVFPSEIETEASADVMVASSYNDRVKERLAAGGKVLLLPEINSNSLPESVNGNFTPTFWSGMWFPTTFNTMGFVTDETHPVFADFPTESHSNWQWWNLAKNSRPINLDKTDTDYRPIMQAIDNFGNDKTMDGEVNNRKLGLIFEGEVDGGSLLVCSIDLTRENADKPEAKQLLSSIIQYMESDKFTPSQVLDGEVMSELIPGSETSGSIAVNDSLIGYPKPFASFSLEDIPNRLWNIINDNTDINASANSWTNWQEGEQRSGDHIGVDFGRDIRTENIAVHVFTDYGCQPPEEFELQYWDGSNWVSAQNQKLDGKEVMTQGENVITFDEITTSKLRLVMQAVDGYALAVSEFQVFGDFIMGGEDGKTQLKQISLNTENVKNVYELGETIDITGLAVKAVYGDGSEKVITSDQCYITGFDSDTVGRKEISVSYTENGITQTATYFVEVRMHAQNDVRGLELAITMAEKLKHENNAFTEQSWKAMEEALAVANSIMENPEAFTQQQIDDVFYQLMDACDNLENGVQKTGLKAAIDGAKEILEDQHTINNYTQESLQTVKDAVEAAEKVFEKEFEDVQKGQIKVNEAFNELIKAVTSMLRKDMLRLQQSIDLAETLLENADKYTTSTVKALQDALESARDALNTDDPETYKTAHENLDKAITGLHLKGNKAELQAAIDKAEDILVNSDEYLQNTLTGLQEYIDEARTVYEDGDALQDEIDLAIQNLIAEILKVRVLGDINLDGQADTSDGALLLKYVAEIEKLTEEQTAAADVNRDGTADTADASQILMFTSERIDSFR